MIPQAELGEVEVKYKRYVSFGQVTGVTPSEMEKFGLKVAQGGKLTSGKKVVVGAIVPENFVIPERMEGKPRRFNLLGETVSLLMTGGEGTTGEGGEGGKPIKVKAVGVLEKKGMETDTRVFLPLRKARQIQR